MKNPLIPTVMLAILSVSVVAGQVLAAGAPSAQAGASAAPIAPGKNETPTAQPAAKTPTPAAAGSKAAPPAADGKASAGAVKPAAGNAAAPAAASSAALFTVVEMMTTEGRIVLELADDKAPVTVNNFVSYVKDKFYDGTVFHRVIDGFMIQGGGFSTDGGVLSEKPTKASIANEGKNGLKNDAGTIAMARRREPDSASSQFFINLVNNNSLNYPSPDGHGYAVFGRVTEGMDVVEKIGKKPTTMRHGMGDFPIEDVKIVSVRVLKGPGIN